MKKLVGVIMGWLMFFLLLDIAPLQAREEVDGYFTVTGGVRNKDDRKKLENVNVSVPGTNIGTVTNSDGIFSLKIKDAEIVRGLEVSHIGYLNTQISLKENKDLSTLTVWMIPAPNLLNEIVILGNNPCGIVEEAIRKISVNYSPNENMLTTFYREGVQLKNKFQNLTEAVFKVYKSPLDESGGVDQVKLLKMSRMDNRESTDSLIAKIRAGIQACLQLDIMKDLPDFLSVDAEDNPYTYTSGGITSIDDRCINVVSFEQKQGVKEPLYCGELYIDSENGALLQARIEMQPRYIKKTTRIFVVRQAPSVNLTAQKVVYTISYKLWRGTYYIHHIRGDLFFKMKKKRTLFSSPTLHTWFEMVTCKVDRDNVARFSRTERVPIHTVLADIDFKYDESFWEEFNTIPLEEELSEIIEKVTLKIEKTVHQEE